MGLYSPIVSTKALLPVCYSLANTYHAGIPILRGLELAADQTRDRNLKRALSEMAWAIKQDGVTLAQAASAQRKHLPEFFIQLLGAGETGGKLDIMLRDLASYYEDRLRIRRRIVADMTLPVLYLLVAWYLGSFSLGLVFSLSEANSGLGFIEAYVLSWSKFQAVVHVLVFGLFLLSVVLGRLGILKGSFGWIPRHTWPLKGVLRKYALARFFRTFGMLVGAGVDIRKCLLGAAATTNHPAIREDLERALPHIEQGATLTQSFAMCRSLTPEAREMLFIGEQSGNLDGSLMKTAEYHQNEANHAVQVMNKILFVLVMLFVSGVIGGIVITFYSRLYGGALGI